MQRFPEARRPLSRGGGQRWAALLWLCLASTAFAAPAALQIEVLSGEGAAYVIGSRASVGLIVRVTDENKRPVEGALVRFQPPADGPTIVFQSGLPVETKQTGPDGKAELWGFRVSDLDGPFEIHVAATLGDAHGEAVIAQKVVTPAQAPRAGSSRKWLWILVAGAAGGAVAAVAGGSKGAAAAAASPGSGSARNPNVPPVPGAEIGVPSVVIGAP